MAFNTRATFVPGGDDYYYLPEVVAPAPHRANEHPTNMQQNVAQMEHQAGTTHSGYGSPQPQYNGGWQGSPQLGAQQHQQPQQQSYGNNNGYGHQLPPHPTPPVQQPPRQPSFSAPVLEVPNFTPFPVLRNPGPNIPPTDEQKEAVLESAREAVLACNDPEQQLTWAQDALSYVEIAIQNEARVSRTQPARSRTPKVEASLKDDAIKIVSFLADQRHPKADFMRGMWYEFGKFGYPVDKPESFQCYKRASERGYSRAWYRMGMQFESGNDPLTAIKYYRMAADAGDSAACYRLGMMTLLGQHGQMQDFDQGLQLIYAAAHTADDNAPQGAYVLGMLQAGELTQVQVPEQYLPKNIPAAKINLERAAFLGFAKAQVRMGSAYELSDLNCGFDPALSLHYNALAARQGEADAEMAISKWFLCGHEGVFEKNEELAFIYAQRAAVDGLPTAQFAMGYFYEVGIFVPTDLKEAKDWYRKADENGNKDARKRIDAVSRSKTISRKDHESISLQRIRDQHGHGQAAMPSISEGPSASLDMPDPSKLSLNNTPHQQRLSPAPYPTQGPGPGPNAPDFRPTSAFGINPNLRPQSAASLPNGRQPDPYGPAGQQARPHSTAHDGYSGGYGQRPGGQLPQGPSVPVQSQRMQGPPRPGSAAPPGGRPQQGAPGPRPAPPPQTNSAPQVNLGFSAPVDTSGADRPNWTPKMSGAGEGPRPRPAGGLPSQQGGRPNPNGGYQQSSGRPQPGLPAQPKPPQGQGLPPTTAQSRPQQAAPAPQAPAQPPAKVSASSAASKPPGKGPKTFDQMGIPQQAEDKDCIVM